MTDHRGHADYYATGDWNEVCYECGRKFKASELRKHWKGYYVCPKHWEPRHTQDFVRSVIDVQTPPWAQPMPADSFRILGGDFIVPGDSLFIPDITESYATDPGSSTGFTSSPQIADGGTGYTIGDKLTLSGGTVNVIVTDIIGGVITGAIPGSTGDGTTSACSYTGLETFDPAAKSAHITLSNGNLTATCDSSPSQLNVAGTGYLSGGKHYYEVSASSVLGGNYFIGLGTAADSIADGVPVGSGAGYSYVADTGRSFHSSTSAAYGAAWTNSATLSVLWDADAGTLHFWLNGVDQGLAFSGVTGSFRPVVTMYDSGVSTVNFGETAWAYNPPAGYHGWSSSTLCSVATTGGTGTGAKVTIPTIASVSYATFDPVAKASGITLSNGNLTADTGRLAGGLTVGFGSNPYQNGLGSLLMKNNPPMAGIPIGLFGGMTVLSTKFQATGASALRRYCEVSYYGGLPIIVGLVKSTFPWATTGKCIGQTVDSYGWLSVGTLVNNTDGTRVGLIASPMGLSIACLYFDTVAGTMYIALGANAPVLAWSGLSGTFCPAVTLTTLNTVTINYGATPFVWLGHHPMLGSIDNLYTGWTG